jgi:hypothetical protein
MGAAYSAFETLRNGRRIEIRAPRPEDRDDFAFSVAGSARIRFTVPFSL